MTASFDMLVGNRGLAEDLTGFQTVGRAARLVLIDGLNAEIDRQQKRWRTADDLFEGAGNDVGIRDAGIEQVPATNVFQGPHKSLISSPLDRFPNVSLTAYAVRPGPGDVESDRFDVVEVGLLVEVMVKAGPVTTPDDQILWESIAHQRIERTSEAVLVVMRNSVNLLGAVRSISQPRGGLVNSTFSRDSGGGKGPKYVLHGSRFQYALTRQMSIHQ